MPSIDTLFNPESAGADGFSRYDPGSVAYVTNGFRDNGVVGFVRPKAADRVYETICIVLSAFCEATVQLPPFIARGNGGSGLIVLEPRKTMTADQLVGIAAYINSALRWRFSWSRQASVDRVRSLNIPVGKLVSQSRFAVEDYLPAKTQRKPLAWSPKFRPFPLESLFSLAPGDYHNAGELPEGAVPLISCGDADNGIARFVSVPQEHIYHGKLTIAFNGMNTLTTKFHPYDFAAKDDVAVCTPINPLRASTLIFIQIMMDRERWRYFYYRKCFMEKLKRQSVLLPHSGKNPNEDLMEEILGSTTYWSAIKPAMVA